MQGIIAYLICEQLTRDDEPVPDALDFPCRRIELCNAGLGFSAVRTCELETLLAGDGTSREISGRTTCSEFRARRFAIRRKGGRTTQRLHTLNGSMAIGVSGPHCWSTDSKVMAESGCGRRRCLPRAPIGSVPTAERP